MSHMYAIMLIGAIYSLLLTQKNKGNDSCNILSLISYSLRLTLDGWYSGSEFIHAMMMMNPKKDIGVVDSRAKSTIY